MSQLRYVLCYLLNFRGSNIIKVISLSLGLFVGLILFAQVAFEMSFDNFYPDKDQLYLLHVKGQMKGETSFEGGIVNAPYAPTMYQEFPEVISATNTFCNIDKKRIESGENIFEENTLRADSLFFQTLGFKVLEGNPEELKVEDVMFVSESFAKRAFGDLSKAVGQTCKMDEVLFKVRGIFADVPKNGHLQFDVVASLTPYTQGAGWLNNDAYRGYVKLAPGTDPKAVEAKILDMRHRHYDVDQLSKRGYVLEHYLKPITKLHSGDKVVRRTCLILALLGFCLLFAAMMNYVLISISSLATRAKSIGVHKCGGASNGNIFSMFMYETLILILISLVVTALAILVFREPIEVLVKTDLSAIFSVANLWIVGVVLVVLVVMTGVIPARIFSSIPVTQVFHSYKDNKRRWKQSLLFLQFSGTTFLLTLLAIIYFQYQMMLNRDMGFQTEQVAFTELMWKLDKDQLRVIKEEFLKYPGVESATLTNALPSDFASGQHVDDLETKDMLFSCRFISVDSDYFHTLGMTLVAGSTFTEGALERNEIIVNETFARQLNKSNPVGEKVFFFQEAYTIVGVVKDYQYLSFFVEIPAIALLAPSHPYCNCSILALKFNKEITPGMLEDMTRKLQVLSHQDEYTVQPYVVMYERHYKDVRLFRDSVTVAGLIMLVVTLLGLFGYITDEVHRRTKEIAIRKVNGATAVGILKILSLDLSYICVPSILIGLGISYIVGLEWLQQFVVKIPLSIALLGGSGLVIWLVIQLCVVIRAWDVANENPVKSIKSE